MEPWQRRHFVQNWGSLLELTVCNEMLMAALRRDGVLSSEDIDGLKAAKGEYPKNSFLFDIISKRILGYEKLTKALVETLQSGAFQILFDRFRINGVSNPLERCSIRMEMGVVISTETLFQGKIAKLEELFPGVSTDDMKDYLIGVQYDYDYIDIFITKKKPFVLAVDTTPRPPPFYIPLPISKRIKIDPKIFAEECPDVFVFKEMNRVDLSELAKPNRTSSSSNQLFDITPRFILLDCEGDWELICGNAKVPIHLIKYEKPNKHGGQTRYILHETKGDSKVLWRYADLKYAKYSESVTEEDFIKELEVVNGPSGLCICDSPGMGKSWLLANLARSINKKYPSNIIFFTPLSTFAKNVEKPNPHVNMTQVIACNIMLDRISTSPFSKAILLMLVSKGYLSLEMFFDGLDEVPTEDLEWTLNFLKALIHGTGNVRIYITSRPNVRRHLETTLGVVACDILPFTRQNQINFLVDSWHWKIVGAPKEKLTKFATHCLEYMERTFNDEERDMMGIPLQCFFLAECYAEESKVNADPRRELDTPLMKITSVYDMYKTVIENRFSPDNVRGNVNVSDEEKVEEIILEARTYHVWRALQLLFPDFETDYAGLEDVHKRASKSTYLSFGLLEETVSLCTDSSSDSQWNVNFVHRTIAEYFAAEYIAHILLKHYTNVESDNHVVARRISFYVQKLFSDWYEANGIDLKISPYQVILNFLNGYLRNNEPISVEQFVANTVLNSLDAAGYIGTLQFAICDNYDNLFKLLRSILRSTNVDYLASYQKYLMEPNIDYDQHDNWPTDPLRSLFCFSAIFANAKMMDQCFQLFRESFQIDVDKTCQEWNEDWETPLEIAVEKGDYEIVEYLIEKFSYEPEDLIRSCICSSRNESREMVRNRIEICRLLLKGASCLESSTKRLSKNVVRDIYYDEFDGCLSVDFMIFLLDMGADPEAFHFSYEKRTILHDATLYMPSNDFNELCHYLLKNFKQIFRPNAEEWISPVHYILRKVENVSEELIEKMLDHSGIDVSKAVDDNDGSDYNDGYGDNLLTAAVCGSQSVGVMNVLIRRGADINFKDKYGRNVLHLAAVKGNVETVEYVMSLGVPLEEKDMKGRTPLLCAYKHLETMKHLVSKGVDIYATDNDGDNVPHLAAAEGNVEAVEFFVSLGVPFDKKNMKGKTPLLCAYKHLETMKYLVSKGVDIYATDNDGNNVAHLALDNEYLWKHHECLQVMVYLIESIKVPALFQAKNNKGQTVLQVAENRNFTKIVEYLRRN